MDNEEAVRIIDSTNWKSVVKENIRRRHGNRKLKPLLVKAGVGENVLHSHGGAKGFNVTTLLKVSRATGMTPDELLGIRSFKQ